MSKSLLILGAGLFGAVTKEVAEAMGEYSEISFLDDLVPSALGKLNDYDKFTDRFTDAIVAIDDPFIRQKYTKELKSAGYHVPVLVHPTAYVSPSAKMAEGTIVEAMAAINANCMIGPCCIISMSATINHHAAICEFVHVSCNSTIMYNTVVKAGTETQPGQLFFAEPNLKGTKAWMPNYSFDDGN